MKLPDGVNKISLESGGGTSDQLTGSSLREDRGARTMAERLTGRSRGLRDLRSSWFGMNRETLLSLDL